MSVKLVPSKTSLHIGDIRGEKRPLAHVNVRDEKIDIHFLGSTEGKALVMLNWPQADRLAKLLTAAVKVVKAAQWKHSAREIEGPKS